MDQHRRTELDSRGLSLRTASGGTEHLDLFAGELHYWRVERRRWERCLRAMKSIGLRVVSTYVPWSVHERAPGDYDWSGERDLAAFLSAAAGEGLRVLLRPGPHVGAELTGFGFPQRVLDADAMRARTGRGTPVWLPAPPRMFAVPSYASTAFQREVAAWYAEFGRVVAPHVAPDGPVAALQVDNEHQLFFRVGAFDHDYHPDALAWWDELSGGLEAPRAWNPDDAGRCARWVRFKEDYAARALAWMNEALDEVGFAGVARYHNFPPSEPTLAPVPRAERAIDGVAGLDFYHQAKDQDTYWARAAYLAGTASTLPLSPEVGAGGPPWLLPMSQQDQQSVTLGLLGAGLRGLNFYMAVERERWYGAPIGDDGTVRPFGRWLEHLLRALDELNWTRLRRAAPLALVMSRTDARYAIASSLVDPVTPVVTELLGIAGDVARDDDAIAHRRWWQALTRAADRAHIPFAIVDEECATEQLARYEVVVLPTLRRVNAELWARLPALVAAGARVVIGPGRPKLDELEQPLASLDVPKGVGRLQPASLDDLDDLAADLAALVGDVPTQWIARDPARVRCALYRDPGGSPAVLFVANRTRTPLTADIAVPEGAALADALTTTPVPVEDGAARVALAGHEVRMLRVERGS